MFQFNFHYEGGWGIISVEKALEFGRLDEAQEAFTKASHPSLEKWRILDMDTLTVHPILRTPQEGREETG